MSRCLNVYATAVKIKRAHAILVKLHDIFKIQNNRFSTMKTPKTIQQLFSLEKSMSLLTEYGVLTP